EGILAVIQVDGWRGNYLMLAEDMPLLHSVARGGVPRAWKPLAATTLDEVTFLSSLDIVSARGRAKQLFDFEYLWEVYKPAHQRRWGYYTLPILYGDELVARLDPKLERASMALQIKGYWQEQPALDRDPAYVHALANGLVRFAEFLGARRVDLSGVGISRLKRQLKREVEACLPVGAASST
ncbi:MAG TPA: crosslink repair DNA glycosylase YcaQ family protein, partial [Anaerolineales bacterium]|nr:crosslink repair DNA glycosylase YcaQ family protein [Anaerolineales bacterium]